MTEELTEGIIYRSVVKVKGTLRSMEASETSKRGQQHPLLGQGAWGASYCWKSGNARTLPLNEETGTDVTEGHNP